MFSKAQIQAMKDEVENEGFDGFGYNTSKRLLADLERYQEALADLGIELVSEDE